MVPLVFPCPVNKCFTLNLGYVCLPNFQWDSTCRKLDSFRHVGEFLSGHRFGIVSESNGIPREGGVGLYPKGNSYWTIKEMDRWCGSLTNDKLQLVYLSLFARSQMLQTRIIGNTR